MSLARFRSSNHPQQSRRWGADDSIDDRATHPLDFAGFDERHGPYTLDVAAAAHNAKCDRYFDVDADGLAQDWTGERVWCNPPYSDIAPWIRKAWDRASLTLWTHTRTEIERLGAALGRTPAERTGRGREDREFWFQTSLGEVSLLVQCVSLPHHDDWQPREVTA